MRVLKNIKQVSRPCFVLVSKPRMRVPLDSKQNFQIIMSLTETDCWLHVPVMLLFRSLSLPKKKHPDSDHNNYNYGVRNGMQPTPTLIKWPLRMGAPKSTSDNPTSFSDKEGSNPNPNANIFHNQAL
jgi:hypothetical protein